MSLSEITIYLSMMTSRKNAPSEYGDSGTEKELRPVKRHEIIKKSTYILQIKSHFEYSTSCN